MLALKLLGKKRRSHINDFNFDEAVGLFAGLNIPPNKSYANFGKLRFKTEYEQQIWGECARLITNCVIFYNASILSNLLEYRERIGDIEGAEQLKQVSPVAWQHVNFFGRYEFGKRPQQIDMKAIVEQLARVPVQQHLAD